MLIDVYESFFSFLREKEGEEKTCFTLSKDENLFTVRRDRVRVYCKSNLFPRVRDIEQDRL